MDFNKQIPSSEMGLSSGSGSPSEIEHLGADESLDQYFDSQKWDADSKVSTGAGSVKNEPSQTADLHNKSSQNSSSNPRFDKHRQYRVAKTGVYRRPASIPAGKDNHKKVLKLLRSYHQAVHLDLPSSASRTSGPGSMASSISSSTTLSTVFSKDDGKSYEEVEPRGRTAVENSRRAFVRALKTCSECRTAKTKCPVAHHMLEDLLLITNKDQDLNMIEWAINTDGSAPASSTEASASLSALDASQPYLQGSRTLPVRVSHDMVNNEIVDDLIGSPREVNQNLEITSPRPSQSRVDRSMPPPPTPQPRRLSQPREEQRGPLLQQFNPATWLYSIAELPNDAFIVGERFNDFGGQPDYRCQAYSTSGGRKTCDMVFSSTDDLHDHYCNHHEACTQLEDGPRLVCRTCGAFNQFHQSCCGQWKNIVERVYACPLFENLVPMDIEPDWVSMGGYFDAF